MPDNFILDSSASPEGNLDCMGSKKAVDVHVL